MQLWVNNWAGALLQVLPAGATVASVAPDVAARLTGLGSGDHYVLTLIGADGLGAESAWEIVRATSAAGGNLTIERHQEGTPARDWPAGTRIEARLTAEALSTLSGHIEQLQGAVAELLERVAALEAGGGAPDGALTDDSGNTLSDAAGNIITTGA